MLSLHRCFTGVSRADVIIIGSPDIQLNSMTPEQVKKLYLGKTTAVNGIAVTLTDCKMLQQEFLSKFTGKSVRKYNKTWLKKIFAEGLTAPTLLKDTGDVVDFVKGAKNAIGYVSTAPAGVKILLKQ